MVVVLGSGACGASDPVVEARALLEANELDEALDLLQDAVEDEPSNAELNHLYGRALIANGQVSLATWPLRRASEDPAWAVPSGLLLTQTLVQTQNGHEAVRAADAVLAIEPDNLRAVRLRADARLGSEQGEDALDDLDRLIEAFPDELIHREKKLDVLLGEERYDDAEAVLADLREAIKGRDDLGEQADGLLCTREAELEIRRGDAEQAKSRIVGCLEKFPDNRPVFRQAIEFFDREGDWEHANDILRGAIEARPGDIDLQQVLATRLAQQGGDEEAARVLRESAEQLDTPAAWVELRNYQVRNDDMEGARASTDRLLQAITGIPPGEPGFDYADVPEERLFEAAVVFAMTGDFARAEAMKEHLAEKPHVAFLEARIHFEKGQLEEALEAWDRAFRLFPSNAGARYLAGMTALRLGRIEHGIEHFRNSLRTSSTDSDVGLALANVQIAMGHPHAAIDSVFYHLRGNPTDVDALRLQSRLTTLAGTEGTAKAAGAMLSAHAPGLAIADHALEIERRVGSEAALTFLDENVKVDLDDPELVEALAAWVERMMNLGRTEEALVRTAASAAAHPDHAGVQALHGASLAAAQRADEAKPFLERALTLDPDQHQALLALARLELAAGDVDDAVAHFEHAAKAEPRDPTPVYAAVDALEEADRNDRVRARLEALLDERPWEGRAAHRLAVAALEAGDHGDRTLAHAERASIFYAEVGPAAFETLGQVQLARGDRNAAVIALRQAASLGAGGASGLYRVGTALSSAGDVEGAIRALEAALTIEDFPEAARAREALAKLLPTSEG